MASKQVYKVQRELLIIAAEEYLKVEREDRRRQKKGLPPMVSDPDVDVRTRYYDAARKYDQALFYFGPNRILKALKENK